MADGFNIKGRSRLWFGLQCVAGLLLAGWIWTLVKAPLRAIGYCREYFLSYQLWLLLPVTIVMLAGCAGAVLRRRWGAATVRTTMLYLVAASSVTEGVSILSQVVERVCWGAPLNLGGGPDFGKSLILFMAVSFAAFLFAVLIVVVSEIVVCMENQTENEGLQEARQTAGPKRVMLWGAGLVVGGLLYKSVDLALFNASIMTVGGSIAIVAGSFLAVFGHMRMRRDFLASSAILTALALVVARPVAGQAPWPAVPWLLPFGLAVASLLRKKTDRRLGSLSLGLTILLGTLFVARPLPLYLRFGVYPKPSLTRPSDFPEYMQAPEDATEVQYSAGDEPYLYFFVDDPSSADRILAFIDDHLGEAGWWKLDYDLMNPNVPSSHKAGWSDVAIGPSWERARKYRRWKGDWINDQRQTIAVTLEYPVDEGVSEGPRRIRCMIHRSAPRGLQLKFIENYEKKHGL